MKKEINKTNLYEADRLYQWALGLFKNKDYIKALSLATQSSSIFKNHESFNLIGHIYGELKRYDLEAEAFDNARWEFMILRGSKKNELETYYYYRSSFAYLKRETFDFSYLRADMGIYLTNENEIRYIDNFDIALELRTIRLLSAFKLLSNGNYISPSKDLRESKSTGDNETLIKNLKPLEIHEIALIDANWIILNSKDKLHNKIANAYIELFNITENLYLNFFSFVHNLN